MEDKNYIDKDGVILTQTQAFKVTKDMCSNGMDEAMFKQILTSRKFEHDEQDFHMGIEFAISMEDGGTVCYTGDKHSAELVEYALNTCGELIEESIMLKTVLQRCFDVDCGCSDCRAMTNNVSHGYCKYHKDIIVAIG